MAFDTLQRILDAQSNRIINVGTPTAASDATITDNSTAPQNPAASASAGASFLAAPMNHVHQGVHSVHADANANIYGDARLVSGTGITLTQSGQDITIATSGGTVNKIEIARDTQSYVTGSTEQIVAEYYVSLDDCTTGNITGRMSAIVKVSAGTGTYNFRTGATGLGAITGSTVRATFTSTSTTEETKTNAGSAFTNPTGALIVQVSCVNSGANNTFIRGIAASIG